MPYSEAAAANVTGGSAAPAAALTHEAEQKTLLCVGSP